MQLPCGSPDHSSTVGCVGVCILSLNPISSITSSGTTITLSDAHTYATPGSYTATVTVTDQGGGTATKTVTEVAQGPQAITFAAIPDHTYGDAPFTISATGGGSGQPVTFTSSTPSVCSVSQPSSGVDSSGNGTGGGTVTILAAGACTIAADQAGTAIYTPAPTISQSFTVHTAPLTITADNQNTVYGQPLPPFTVTPSGLVNGDTLASLPGTLHVTTTATQLSAPGPYTLTPSGLSSPNYTITYDTGTLTISKDAGTVVLTANANPAPFGQPVVLTTTVGAAAPGSGTPSGIVTFLDGGTPIGTATLTNGQASLTTATLLGGSHNLTVSYAGDANFTGGTSAGLAQAITFSRTINGTANGPQTINAGESVLISGAVNGPLTIHAGASVSLVGAHVTGPLRASGAGAVALCGSTVTGPVSISGSTGFVLLGAGTDDVAVACAANTFTGPLTLNGNQGGVEIEGNTVTGPLSLTNTTGAASNADSATPEIEGNTIRGPLSCSGNTPAPTADGHPNTVIGPKSGQCAAPGM